MMSGRIISFVFMLIFFSSDLFSQNALFWTGNGNNSSWTDSSNWVGTHPPSGYPDQNTDVTFSLGNMAIPNITINEAIIEVKSMVILGGGFSTDTLKFKVGKIDCYGVFSISNPRVIIKGQNVNTNAILNLKGTNTSINYSLQIDGEDQHRMEMVIHDGAAYLLGDTLVQKYCVLEMYDGVFYTKDPGSSQSPAYDIDINKIKFHSPGNQTFLTKTSTLTLRSNSGPIEGINEIDVCNFDSTDIVFRCYNA